MNSLAPSGSVAEPIRKLWDLWRDSRPEEADALLKEIEPHSAMSFLALLRVDQHERWRRGIPRRAEDYIELFPSLKGDNERLLDVVFSEFLLRGELGETPDPGEYYQRFPQLAEAFACQYDLRRLLQSQSDLSVRKTVLSSPPFQQSGRQPIAPPGYEILALLGEGGMGVVYKARQMALGRVVALKMLLGPRGDSEELARFRSEAEVIARLHHPNVVQVFDFGEVQGRPYFSMEWVEGGSLSDQLRNDPLAPRPAAMLVEVLARTMHTVHGHGLVHRDLKPANILLERGLPSDHAYSPGSDHFLPKIADFGLVKELSGGTGQTQSGAILGTPSYMAPEQAEGKREVGPLADVYALGAILYEALTGRPPFQAATPLETLRQVTSVEPLAPSRLQPGLPHDLETITLKCLAKKPEDRYASAAALADDLSCFLADRPIAARRASSRERLARWGRRNPWLAGVSAALFLVLVGTAIGGVVLSYHLSQSLDQARAAEHEGKRKLFASYLSDANATRMSGQVGQRFHALQRIREAMELSTEIGLSEEDKLSLRNIAIGALCLPDLEQQPHWSLDDRGMAPSGVDVVHARHARAMQQLERLPAPAHRLLGGSWVSRDGRYLAVGMQPYVAGQSTVSTVAVWRVEGEQPVRILETPDEVFLGATDFSPQSLQVAFGHRNGEVSIYDLKSGQCVRRLPAMPGSTPVLAFHPTLPHLAVANDRDVRLWNVTTGISWARLGTPGTVTALAWHPRGHRIATASDAVGGLCLWEAETGRRLIQPWHRESKEGALLSFSHAGDCLTSSGWNDQQRFWDATSGELLATNTGPICPHFGSDDCTVGDFTGTTQRWAGGQERRTLKRLTANGSERFVYATIHPNGRLLAGITPTGLAFLDLLTGEEVGFLAGSFGRGTMVFDTHGTLWVGGRAGLIRLPIRAVAGELRFQIGPPEWVVDQSLDGDDGFAVGANGVVAIVPLYNGGARLVHMTPPRRTVRLGPQLDVRYIHVSPDSRLVVTGTHFVGTAPVQFKVWDAATGQLKAQLPRSEVDGVTGFSPNGRWLYTSSQGKHRRLEVHLLEPVEPDALSEQIFSPPGGETLGIGSPDGRLRAYSAKDGVIRLVLSEDPETEVARFPTPTTEPCTPTAFTPDGRHLLAKAAESGTIVVFDLARIRAQLAELGLDWHEQQSRPALSHDGLPLPERIAVELLEPEVASSRTLLGQSECRRAAARVQADPRDADAHFRLGKFLYEAGEPIKAHEHLSEALTLDPEHEEALSLRAGISMRLARWSDVEADTSRYLQKIPYGHGVRLLRARVRQQSQQHAGAVADLTALLAIDPENSGYLLDRADSHETLGDQERAAADRTRARQFGQSGVRWLNAEAWGLVTGPSGTHDPALALKLMQKALLVAPDFSDYLNTLGLVQYRNGLYREAIPTLEKSLAASNGGSDGFDLYFLAACHARLGDLPKARDCFARADAWIASKKDLPTPWPDELREFRAEFVPLVNRGGNANP